jgi:hypothetical protein
MDGLPSATNVLYLPSFFSPFNSAFSTRMFYITRLFRAEFANSLYTIHNWLSVLFYLAHIKFKKKINLN